MPRFGVALFIEPTTHHVDIPSTIAKQFADHYGQGLAVGQLWGDEANPETVRQEILRLDPLFIFHTGHSFPCVMTVQNLEPLFSMATGEHELCKEIRNLDLVKGRVIHSNSCYAGKEIGKYLVKKGARAFFGSVDEFLFLIPKTGEIDRATLSPFLAEYMVEAVLLSGGTVGEAQKNRLMAFDREIEYWTTGEGKDHPAAPLLARILEADKNIAVAYGDETFAVAPPRDVGPLTIKPEIPEGPNLAPLLLFSPLLLFLQGDRGNHWRGPGI